ncbi:MAG: hypothetical protein Q9N68_14125 [Gammaproteobacteria bacterium]|nr:hypothetical protein [Gammaproteobacteria bacterium]
MTFMSLLTALPAVVAIAVVVALLYYGYKTLHDNHPHWHNQHHH